MSNTVYRIHGEYERQPSLFFYIRNNETGLYFEFCYRDIEVAHKIAKVVSVGNKDNQREHWRESADKCIVANSKEISLAQAQSWAIFRLQDVYRSSHIKRKETAEEGARYLTILTGKLFVVLYRTSGRPHYVVVPEKRNRVDIKGE